MKAFSSEGKEIIETSQAQLGVNQKDLVRLIQQAQLSIAQGQIEKAKNEVDEARGLAFESSRLAFIGVTGLKAQVINEEIDGRRAMQFNNLSDQLYELYCDFWKVSCNVVIQQKLLPILNNLDKIH